MCAQIEHERRRKKHIGEYTNNDVEYNIKIKNFIEEAKINLKENKLINKMQEKKRSFR